MEHPLVLTFDVGTQSARCLLVNETGGFEDMEQRKYDAPYLQYFFDYDGKGTQLFWILN